MLTSVLPGLRELRAPLSAGVLWLLVVWFSVEPSVPDPDEASGILASAYRLAEPLSAVGLGAVLGFAAYLVGSLSVFLFSGALRQLIPTSAETRFGLTGLSAGGREALEQIPEIRDRFWHDVKIPGSGTDFNQALEYAGRVADYLEFAELLCHDALHRNESCGGHFREEYQTPEGEALRDDANFTHVAAWEYKGDGQTPARHVEPLKFDYVHLTQRSYK